MKLVRSWPVTIPEGRSYVVDDIPKFLMGDGAAGDAPFCYRRLANLNDDVVLIEWDIAIGGEQLRTFMQRAHDEPDKVRVAPYLLYRGRSQHPFYVHRVREPGMRTWVKPGDPYCHLFGFGLIYLPRQMIADFVAALKPGAKFGDTEFSHWHFRTYAKRQVPIDWDCHAIHLHYQTPEVPPYGDVARHR